MGEITIIGIDLAKNVFQVHGAAADGSVVFRKKLTRPQFARFIAEQPPCLVAMEACASAHHWAREMSRHGHKVRLIAPHYVKPFIKRQKNDAADAEAIVEAALRPTMRFVEPKTKEQQARAVAFRTREQLVKQRTEAVNALRSHLYEFGHVTPVGIGYVPRLERVIADPDADIPDLAREICRMLLDQALLTAASMASPSSASMAFIFSGRFIVRVTNASSGSLSYSSLALASIGLSSTFSAT